MGKKRNTAETAFRQGITWRKNFNHLYALAISRFRWTGFPMGFDTNYMERTLFFQGNSLVFREPVLGTMINAKALYDGGFDLYGQPIRLTGVLYNGVEYRLGQGDSVLVYDNLTMCRTAPAIQLFADRLTNIDLTVDTNIHAQKTPVIVSAPEELRLTMNNMSAEYDANLPTLYINRTGADPLVGISVLKTEAPYLADKLTAERKSVMCEALTYLGINNMATEKRERAITPETLGNAEEVKIRRRSYLSAREQAAEKINAMFGININVSYDSYSDSFDSDGNYIMQGVKDSGRLYNAPENSM